MDRSLPGSPDHGHGEMYELQPHDLARGVPMRDSPRGGVPLVRWENLAARAARNDKPAILLQAMSMAVLTDPQQIRIGLEDAWTTCEWPGRAADYDVWLFAFDVASADDDHYLHEHELRERSSLPETPGLVPARHTSSRAALTLRRRRQADDRFGGRAHQTTKPW